ncbi:MAG: OadG family protein [Kiritimatiellaeota bacterium]|nr:OadG family protein [Kiritimatiellota bacterium]
MNPDDVLVLKQGGILLATGMAFTFGFLLLLVLVTKGAALVVPRFNHLMPDTVAKAAKPKAAATDDNAAIAIAVAVATARG